MSAVINIPISLEHCILGTRHYITDFVISLVKYIIYKYKMLHGSEISRIAPYHFYSFVCHQISDYISIYLSMKKQFHNCNDIILLLKEIHRLLLNRV